MDREKIVNCVPGWVNGCSYVKAILRIAAINDVTSLREFFKSLGHRNISVGS
jgi:hypothetical protein